jgi:hypothetical protein
MKRERERELVSQSVSHFTIYHYIYIIIQIKKYMHVIIFKLNQI